MSLGLLDHLGRPLDVPRKAEDGPYAWQPLYQPILGSRQLDAPRISMWDAQAVYIGNRHVRKVERVISQGFASVDWHLEDGDGVRIGSGKDENDDPRMLAIRALIERPYKPLPTDPQNATPKTRSALWNITCRHMGVCGPAFWYMDQVDALAGTPLQFLYINPARMSPGTQGGMLTHWVLDRDQPSETRLDLREVLAFHLEPPDTGFLSSGLVASAASMLGLTRTTDRHAAQMVDAGGRMVGIYSPKGTDPMADETYRQLVADLRTITDMADSTKRSMVLKGPVEFHQTSVAPDDMRLVELMEMSGKQVAELWNVPQTQYGGDAPTGLNSGESKAYDEAVVWQKAIHPRLKSFAETLQYEFLDRFADLGLTVTLVIDEPEFDDEQPRYTMAQAATTLPLTNKERREMVGLDPFGDERDEEVWMTNTMSRVYPEPETPPQLVPFTGQEQDAGTDEQDNDAEQEADADQRPTEDAPTGKADTDGLDAALRSFLARWAHRTSDRVVDRYDHITRKPADTSVWWDARTFEAEMADVLEPYVRSSARQGYDVARRSVPAAAGKASLDDLLGRLMGSVGLRIKGIGDTTREMVQRTIRKGIEDGLGARDLGDLIERSAGFDEYRAETIARTETATVLNESAIESYREFGVTQVEVDDGDEDDVCAAAHGSVWSIEQAQAAPLGHPNCVRSFSPIIATAAGA